MKIATKLTLLSGGLVISALGLLIAGLGLLGLIDPVGTKMSDDADPLGLTTMADKVWCLALIGVGVAKMVGGGYLIGRIDRKR